MFYPRAVLGPSGHCAVFEVLSVAWHAREQGGCCQLLWVLLIKLLWIPPCSVPGSCLAMKIGINVVIPPGQ